MWLHPLVGGALACAPLAWQLRPGVRLGPATVAGFATYAVFFGIQLQWMPAVLETSTRLNVLIYLAAVVIHALIGGSIGFVAARLHSARIPAPLAFATGWVAAEWIRSHAGPLAFPWLRLGSALTSTPDWLTPARWIGEGGVSFLIALFAGLIVTVPTPSSVRRALRNRVGSGPPTEVVEGLEPPSQVRSLALPILFVLNVAWAALATTYLPRVQTPARSVAVVTTEFGRAGVVSVEDRMAWLESAFESRQSDGTTIEAVLIPEGTLPVPLARRPDLVRRLAALAHQASAALIVGAYGVSDDRATNSVFVVDASGIQAQSDKRQRVAVAESGFARGSPEVLRTGGLRWAPLVCFESLFAPVARSLVSTGADVLFNPTSESWFLDGGRLAALQHGQHLIVRAIENRRWVVRAANDGNSMVINPRGEVTWTSEGPGVEVVRLAPVMAMTLFSRMGDVVSWLCGLIGVALLLGHGLSFRRGR